MNDSNETAPEDRDLWRRVRPTDRPATPTAPLDDNRLAAYIDGTASEDDTARIEAGMLRDPALLQAVADVREIEAAGGEAVPAETIQRIRGTVERELSMRGTPAPHPDILRPTFSQRIAGWAAAAALIVTASVFGYYLGEDTSRRMHDADTVASRAEPGIDVVEDDSAMNLTAALTSAEGDNR